MISLVESKNYLVVNELQKFIRRKVILDKFWTYMLRKKLKSTKKWLWCGFIKIKPISNHPKVHNVFLVECFWQFFCIYVFIFYMSYIETLKICQIKIIQKNAYTKKHRKIIICIFQFQMSIIIFLVHICYNIFT